MAIFEIPARNWPMALADAIDQAQDGDTIQVHNWAMQELAETARQRKCLRNS
jgi:hypothetical protein